MPAADELRQVASRYPAGVTVVMARTAEGGHTGFTATAFSSVSMTPPLVLVCLGASADCHSVFAVAEAMTISVLSTEQRDIAMKFATRGADKLAGTPTLAGEHTALPLVAGAVAHLECRIHQRVVAGDHTILIGEVLAGRTGAGEALIYADRAFSRVVALPAPAAPET